ncbi:apolipoprotein N-acyltransferase [Micromonospora sp. NBC_01699]|uniref:apolipoprotein N-acyltransferase n=1 Tax=Micromonospora sp. NBC_01699 TaxID=2975984 RepID=UPI002E3630B3|nr:apolipoprotein N-acyltransferase [Micromonospora sp. NBC_01699]
MVDTRVGAGRDPDPVRPRPLPLWVAVLAALAGGGALLAAFPPYGLWWLAPVGVALLAAATHRRRLRAGAGLGALTGLALFVPMLSWTNLHTGDLPWLLLSGLQAGYLALLGLATALVSPVVDRWRWSWPVVTGLLWVAQEALRDRTPFGGFPWGRLAFSQADAPLVRWAAVGGAPLVTFGTALVGGFLVAAAWWAVTGRRPTGTAGGRGGWAPYAALGAAGAVVLVGFLVPLGGGSGAGSATVAIVQGNVPRLGLDFNAQRRAVLENHANATIDLAARVAAGTAQQPDLVVWPENASDVDPLRDSTAAAEITAAADAIRAPILVGAVLLGPGPGQVRNTGLLWLPGTGPDLDQMYFKRHPVPFAEYIPLRSIARKVSSQVDRVRSDFVAGTRPGVVTAGGLTLGDVICFEVAYDEVVRDTVTGGAQLLVVQTNNATFNEAEALQQMAMVRLRAVEHGREALMASTVGVSGFVGADGRVTGATGFNTPAVVVREVHLGDARTVATRVGFWPEVVLVGLAVAALVAAVVVRRRRVVPVDGPSVAGGELDPAAAADAEDR